VAQMAKLMVTMMQSSTPSTTTTPWCPVMKRLSIKITLEGTRNFDGLLSKSGYSGVRRRIQPDEFIDWLNTVERVFGYEDVPEEEKVKIVVIKLKKHASIWWEQLKMKRAREGKQKIRT
jgi:hypothetical protein